MQCPQPIQLAVLAAFPRALPVQLRRPRRNSPIRPLTTVLSQGQCRIQSNGRRLSRPHACTHRHRGRRAEEPTSGLVRPWQKRYFVLRGKRLLRYGNADAAQNSAPDAIMQLSDISTIDLADGDDRGLRLVVRNGGRGAIALCRRRDGQAVARCITGRTAALRRDV